MSTYRFDALAEYNSEVARGIVHTPEKDKEMEREQALFWQQQFAEADAKGWVILGDREHIEELIRERLG